MNTAVLNVYIFFCATCRTGGANKHVNQEMTIKSSSL